MKSPRWSDALGQQSASTFTTQPQPHPLPGGSSHSAGSAPHGWSGLTRGGGRVCIPGDQSLKELSERREALGVGQRAAGPRRQRGLSLQTRVLWSLSRVSQAGEVDTTIKCSRLGGLNNRCLSSHHVGT